MHELRWIALITILPCTAGWATEALAQGSLQFDSEEIVMDLQGGAVEVTGTYHFRVKGGRSPAQQMLYPYPQDARLGAAKTLRLEYRQVDGNWAPLSFDELPPRGVRWHLPPCESETLTVRTVYRQPMRSTYARYIVTTTQYWAAPLRRASFEIRLPPGAKDPSFSYPFRRKGPSDLIWVYEAEDFMPREDIVVSYRR